MYILSQVCAIIAMIVLGSTYIIKNKKQILFLCIFSSIMYSLQYFFLYAYTGMIINILGIVRAVCFYTYSRSGKENTLLNLMLLELMFIVGTIFTWDGPVSLLPLCGLMIFTYATWHKDVKLYKWLVLPVSVLWITYNALVGSLVGWISESILLVVGIIGLFLYYKGNTKETEIVSLKE